ncbi:MAG TPA: hypothetical protein VGH27_30270 [Streptosporangiaceae bacterium]|jgi:hypothetical protein
MLFLLTRKLHPAVNLLLGIIALVAGIIIHADLLIATGAVMTVWAGLRTVRRVRAGQASDGASAR